MMGASNPHPHCQIWATSHIPDEPLLRNRSPASLPRRARLLPALRLLAAERASGDRVIVENDHFTALVPWWAVWPFETMILARRHLGSCSPSSPVTSATPSPTSSSASPPATTTSSTSASPTPWASTSRPVDGTPHPEWHFHAHFYPPLLRSATVRKFMVGFEMLGMPQRDITPEDAAARLRLRPRPGYRGSPGPVYISQQPSRTSAFVSIRARGRSSNEGKAFHSGSANDEAGSALGGN
jgi:UDPglucose--hexose-1-phosphate uridylyltransferase